MLGLRRGGWCPARGCASRRWLCEGRGSAKVVATASSSKTKGRLPSQAVTGCPAMRCTLAVSPAQHTAAVQEAWSQYVSAESCWAASDALLGLYPTHS